MFGRLNRMISLLLVALMALSLCGVAFAEDTAGKPGVLATVNGADVPIDDALADFEYYASMYAAYGMSDEIDALKADIAQFYTKYFLVMQQCAVEGFDQFTDEQLAAFAEDAQSTYDGMLADYAVYFTQEGMSEEEITAATIEYFDSCGYTVDSITTMLKEQEMYDLYYALLTDDIELSDEALQAHYDSLVENSKSTYEQSSYNFEYDVSSGADIYYVPEGFRAVYHILLLLSDEDQDTLYDLQLRQDEIAQELTTEGADEDALNEELDSIQAQIDEMCAPLLVKAEEIQKRLDAGEDFKALMAEYGEDPGMTADPYLTNGYYVSADSVMWEESFRDAAMALENIGDVSAPVLSGYGIHIIYYASDVQAGSVALETIAGDIIDDALEEMKATTFDTAVQDMYDAAEIELFLDNLVYEEEAAVG